jgi:hypothetical protein
MSVTIDREYNSIGQVVHEAQAQDGERLDVYLARVRPQIGCQAFWYGECDAGRVEVRDHFSSVKGVYDRARWFVRWFDGTRYRVMNLPSGERPRMRNGFCHIVKEA